MQTIALPSAPPRIVSADGAPLFGTYQGQIPFVSWDGLAGEYYRSRLWRTFHQKRWHYLSVATASHFVGLAVADVGWAVSAFAYCFEVETRTMAGGLSAMGLPGMAGSIGGSPGEGALTWFTSAAGRIRLTRRPGSSTYALELSCRDGLQVEATIEAAGGPPDLAAILPIAGGVANCTHKSGPLLAQGSIRSAGKTIDFDSGTASLDHTVGLLARHTAWRWASAHGGTVGFNLQSGFNGDGENALWLDGELIPLGPAEFAFDAADPLAPWQIRTTDGLLDVTFTPLGCRREDKELVVAMSRYVQPVGLFSGQVRRHPDAPARVIEDLLGVTEDHAARW